MSVPESFPPQTSSVAQADGPATSPAADAPRPSAARPVRAAWGWRQAAVLLSLAAQVITISALVGVDPQPATWSALLLAVAPTPLALLVFFTPARVARPAVVVTAVVLVVGIIGDITHMGVFFIPALAALVGAGLRLWQEQR
jgi:hypothetical protein